MRIAGHGADTGLQRAGKKLVEVGIVFGTMILTFLFVVGLMLSLSKYFTDEKDEEKS